MPGMKRAVLVMGRAEIVWAGVRLAAQPFLNGLSDARTTLAAFGLLPLSQEQVDLLVPDPTSGCTT
jgi:hypothetical protein